MSDKAQGDEDGTFRRCALSGERRERTELLRLVLDPDNALLPDVQEKAPGRGMWVSLNRQMLEAALKSGKLAKAACHNFSLKPKALSIAEDLGERIDKVLSAQVLRLLGLERGAGKLSLGFEKVRAECQSGRAHMLFIASDAGADAMQKIKGMAALNDIPLVRIFDRTELSLALGRENVVHAALKLGGVTKSLPLALERLSRFRGINAEVMTVETRQEGKRAE